MSRPNEPGKIGLFMPSNTNLFFDRFGRSTVRNYATKKDQKLEDVWKNERVLIRLFRRLGCAYCRGEAVILSQVSQQLKDAKVRMIGVGDDVGAEEFVGHGFWKGDFYTTPQFDAHKNLEGVHKSFLGIGTLFKASKVMASRPRLFQLLGGKEKWDAIPHSFKGSDSYYGSVVLVGPGNRLHYSYMQKYPGDFPDNEEILAAIASAEKRQPVVNPVPKAVPKALTADTIVEVKQPKKKKATSVTRKEHGGRTLTAEGPQSRRQKKTSTTSSSSPSSKTPSSRSGRTKKH